MVRDESGQVCFVANYCCLTRFLSLTSVWQCTVTFVSAPVRGHVLLLVTLLGFLKERDVDKTGARALYLDVTVYFLSKCFHVVTGYPILVYPMVLSLEFMGIMSQDEKNYLFNSSRICQKPENVKFDGAKYKCSFIYLLLVKAKALFISLNSENIS